MIILPLAPNIVGCPDLFVFSTLFYQILCFQKEKKITLFQYVK